MRYKVTAELLDGKDSYTFTTEATGFLFPPSGNAVINTPTDMIIITPQTWKKIEFLRLDADEVELKVRLDIDGIITEAFTDVQTDEKSGVVVGTIGEQTSPERATMYNNRHYSFFNIQRIETLE